MSIINVFLINNNFIQLLTTSTVECVWKKIDDTCILTTKKSDFMPCTYINLFLFRYMCTNILYTVEL